jgi:hypothetical protein
MNPGMPSPQEHEAALFALAIEKPILVTKPQH